ncbi:MAG: Hsp20 family protein, partial [Desulfovibrio sp.]|nr:Hsp20 family protein [Desulfovibrio sp.]
DDADADAIHASFKDGVLTVEIPRKAPEKPQARSIEIAKG